MPVLKRKKHERFCQEYVIDFNALRAATQAGYSKKMAHTYAWELLQNENIKTRIEELNAQVCGELGINARYVLGNLKEIVERSMKKEMVYDKEGNETGKTEYKPKEAIDALIQLGKHLKLFTEKSEGELIVNNLARAFAELDKESYVPNTQPHNGPTLQAG